MQSKIIEKILNENNKSLQEIIEIVRNNTVFQDVMSDIKEEFFIDDSIHGISHNERVALLACYIGIQEGLNDEELRLVLETAKYHDIGRGFEGNHGQYSTNIIDRNKEYIFPNLNDDEINIIKALCHGHSVDDKRYEEIAELYGIKNIEKFKRLLDIVKDADALDRVRLPRFGQLDEKYLRTETSKRIIDFSRELFRTYRSIRQSTINEVPQYIKITSNYELDKNLRNQLLFDGESYYLVRSLNKEDIENFDNGNGIIPKIDNTSEHTVQDVMAQIRSQHRKTNLISMSEDPNVVLTYDRTNLHRFVLIKLSKDDIENPQKVFSAGEYLLGVMDNQIEQTTQKAPENIRSILERVDNASSIEEILKIINGADRQVSTSLVESKQQYLSEEEQLKQSKKIAKCKVLNYYGLMRGITHDEKGKLVDISGFTQIMRMGYSSSEWLYSGKIEQEKIVDIPQILVDSLALVKQAEFQGKDKETLKKVEQEILRLALSGTTINQDNYQLEYSAHNNLKNDLTIDKAFEVTGGQISYRDTNMQMTAIRSLAEMTLNKRKIIKLLQEKLPDIDIEELLADSYCVNQEMVTRQNNRGNQIGRNISFIISDYGYDLDGETSFQILSSVKNLSLEQLNDIVINSVDSQEFETLLVKTRESHQRIQSFKTKTLDSKYMAEAIVEGYNWRKDGNSLTIKERELLTKRLLLNITSASQLHTLYEAISKTQIGRNKFTQNEIFAIIINIAIDGKIGDISWKELIEKDRNEIQNILLDNKEKIQTSVLPISMDLFVGSGKLVEQLKKDLINFGIEKKFIEEKDIRNVYVAKQIVDGYDFGRELTTEERKNLIISVLDQALLNTNQCYLSYLMDRMEQIGLNTQEIYGMIINLGVNGKILDEQGYGYSALIGNTNDACQTIIEYKDKIPTQVTEGTILKAKAVNLSQEEQSKIRQELIELGIEKEFIERKHIQNIYVAKEIVEMYNFERLLSQEEKRAIIRALLDRSVLNQEAEIYLTTMLQNLEKLGLSPQETYGLIIKLGINGSVLDEGRLSYTALLGNVDNAYQKIKEYKDKFPTQVTEETILAARANGVNAERQEKIKQELIELGIEKDFIEKKDFPNVYVAKEIVENYNFGRPLSQEEKRAIIRAILDNGGLDKKGSRYLTTLMFNLEQSGFNTQEIYGTIINLGVNKKASEEAGFDYSALLNNIKRTWKIKKHTFQTQVTEGTILAAKANGQTVEERERIKQELVELGLEKEFIEKKNFSNVYIAKEIVENYGFEQDLSIEEKRATIRAILDISGLNQNGRRYLSTLIYNLEQSEFNTHEIYGIIINLGINGSVIDGNGYTYQYKTCLSNDSKMWDMKNHKGDLRTGVSKGVLLKAVSEQITEEEHEKMIADYVRMGIDEFFVRSKNVRNLYVVKKLLVEYKFEMELTEEEKKSIAICVLDNPNLNDGKSQYLTRMIRHMEDIGWDIQKIYEIIINLGVKGFVSSNDRNYYYTIMLRNKNNILQSIKATGEEIQTDVDEDILIQAVEKANRKRKVTGPDLAKASIELVTVGKGGSELCESVQADYQRLLDEKTKENEKEGSEQDVPN